MDESGPHPENPSDDEGHLTLNDAARGERRYRDFRSHFLPRTRAGKVVVALFLGLLALAEWPVLPLVNRIEPTVFGVPFLFSYLLVVYVAMIVVLLVAIGNDL